MTLFRQIGRPSFTGAPRPTPGVPAPLKGRVLRRRMVMFREARELLPYLPTAEGEATHAVMSGRYDLMVLLAAILQKNVQQCPHLRIATLSFNSRNTSEMAALLRSGTVGSLTLLCSAFFRANNKEEFAEAVRVKADFPTWRLAAARSHCKVVCFHLADGRKLVIEGSPNLRTNSNWEQLVIIQDGELHDWHSRWIDDLADRHEQETRID